MEYGIDELKKELRILLDQNRVSTKLISAGDYDALAMDEIIEGRILDAARFVTQVAPMHMLSDVVEEIDTSVVNKTVGSGPSFTINLSDDFLRLARFCMKGWGHPVFNALSPSSPSYAMACNEYSPVGTKHHPLVFLSTDSSNKMLEVFCKGCNENIFTDCLYVGIPKLDDKNKIEIGEIAKTPTMYYAAYLAANSIQDAETAKRMIEVCKGMLFSNAEGTERMLNE